MNFPRQVKAEQNEDLRVEAVHSLHLLDTEPEAEFDEATRLAAMICQTPMSLVTIVDRHRQWFKSKIGLNLPETPREQAFCAHAIGRNGPLVVPDATRDLRFVENPLVTGDTNVRFYAGMPLNTSNGYTIGTLCVIDTVPRELTQEQEAALAILGRQVSAQIELRTKNKLLNEALAEKQRAEEELKRSNQMFEAFMDHSPLVGFMKDADGRFVYYNRPFQQRFEITATEWLGKNDFELWPEENARQFRAHDLAVLRSGKPTITEERTPSAGGPDAYWRSFKFPIPTAEGGTLLAGLAMDVSRERQALRDLERSYADLNAANERLRELSLTDGMTGLANRRAFDQRLDREFTHSFDTGRPLSLMLIDVDHFKRINDTFGHPTGDQILCTIARVLQAASRTEDLVARYGGEEFAIVLPDVSLQQASVLAERIRGAVERCPWRRRAVTVSVGVASAGRAILGADMLATAADAALYQAKTAGRNQVKAAA